MTLCNYTECDCGRGGGLVSKVLKVLVCYDFTFGAQIHDRATHSSRYNIKILQTSSWPSSNPLPIVVIVKRCPYHGPTTSPPITESPALAFKSQHLVPTTLHRATVRTMQTQPLQATASPDAALPRERPDQSIEPHVLPHISPIRHPSLKTVQNTPHASALTPQTRRTSTTREPIPLVKLPLQLPQIALS